MSSFARQKSYREQLAVWAQELAVARHEAAAAALAAGSTLAHVKLFTDGNLDKRFNKLTTQLDFVAEAMEDLPDRVADYVRTVPLAAYDTGASDGERFLRWLEERAPLSPKQRDYVRCQRSRHTIENLARHNRLGHVRFQSLTSLADELGASWGLEEGLQIHLNPIRDWSRFETSALLDEDAEPPCNVLFFAAGREISTAVLEEEGQARVRELARCAPCTLDQWLAISETGDRDALIELGLDLAGMGLAAFG